MSTQLAKVKERARVEPRGRFYALAHLIDEPALKRAYERIRSNAAVGVDGVSKAEYGQNLKENLNGLHERLASMRWRHQTIRRVHLPKEGGASRPIGVSTSGLTSTAWIAPSSRKC
jgi:retron-type reverse transcriptase